MIVLDGTNKILRMKTLIALLIAFTSIPVFAQTKVNPASLKHPVKACLFKVEGNGLTKPSWLFGTIHLGDPNITTLHPRAEAAFEKADAVYTEIDMDPKSQMAIAPMMMRKDGKTLTEALGPELAAQLQSALESINPTLQASAFDPMKTWVVAVSLPMLKMQLKAQTPLDTVLYQRAAKEGKTVGALETAAGQVGLFDKFSEKEIQSMLIDTMKTMKEDASASVDSITRMLNVYLTGTIHEISEFMKSEMARMETDPDFTKRLLKALLDDRNIDMVEKADEIMKADSGKSHFFAVGAGHYTGETAIQDLLEKKGYKISTAFE